MNLLALLGYAVYERTAEGAFRLDGSWPDWAPAGDPGETFLFLEAFLAEAEEFWANTEGRATLYSDLWTHLDACGVERQFCAIAVAGERQFLLIECAERRFGEVRSAVQYAHEAALARDEIAKLNREIELATQAKSEFLARMSHEIRTPLNALLGIAELLAETPLNQQQSEYVRIMHSAGDNLLAVINDVLDFSKVEAGRVELENVAFSLSEIVEGASAIAAVRAKAKGLEVSSRLADDVPKYLIGDPARLQQILLNLLGNATKFTSSGRISLTVKREADQIEPGALRFSVSDTGIGIPADRIATIFDSFSQADPSTTRQYGGTGLGLAISRRFVELMGGRIWAESTVGAGTTIHFTARFGIAEEAPRAADRVPSAAAKSRPLRILLADDSAENRFLIRSYLDGSGSMIDEVADGGSAVEQFSRQGYDLVLMDSDMPVLDGYAATVKIRAVERERNAAETPIFALTAHAWKQAEERSFAAGCTAHLTKPLKRSTLLEAIEKFVPELRGEAAAASVSVEPWLRPVIGKYLENRRADVGKLRAALDSGDYSTVRLLGHQMAGSGGGYGFERISEIGATLEESALMSDAGRTRTGIEDLDRYLLSVEITTRQ
jgi:signal transduction histidine kinase/CheY-like chemotaxis protein/HPt (histidine-containing phosphotransfer) domain-containing protein